MKSLELFSGAGGLAMGLQLAGFCHEGFVEFNKHACDSLKVNFEVEKVFFGDVRDYDFSKVSGVDVVAGGPPCQPFSLGGKGKSHQDSRDMFPYAIKAIEALKPKAFVFENVKGLLRSSFSDYFKYVILRLTYPQCPITKGSWREHLEKLESLTPQTYKGVKYNVTYQLINAADYGVPQIRERVIIVGVRADLGKQWEFPAPTHSEDRLLWDQHYTGSYWKKHGIKPAKASKEIVKMLERKYGLFEPPGLPWQTVRDALCDVPHPKKKHTIRDHVFKDGARVYPGHTGSYIDAPAKTIKAGGHGVPGGENMIRLSDGSVRYFTIYEAKRIQTFPDDFFISGAWGEGMRQIGNAVPVLLAKKLADDLYQLLAPLPITAQAVSY